MKTSIKHLPEHKQAELKAIVAALIPKYSEIEMVILFGSYARGNWVEDKYVEKGITYEYKSDYDLLIVLSKNGQATNENLTQAISDTLDNLNLPTPVHPIFHGVEFVNHELREGNYFFDDIKEGGVLLFTTNRYHLENKREFSAKEAQQKAQNYFDSWFHSANSFLIDFKHGYDRKDYNKAAFELHQAVERFYGTIQLVFTGYKPKTHDIEILGRLAKACDMEFGKVFPKQTGIERSRFKLLKKAYIDARYNMDYKITKEDLDYLSERVQLLQRLTEEICKRKIESLSR